MSRVWRHHWPALNVTLHQEVSSFNIQHCQTWLCPHTDWSRVWFGSKWECNAQGWIKIEEKNKQIIFSFSSQETLEMTSHSLWKAFYITAERVSMIFSKFIPGHLAWPVASPDMWEWEKEQILELQWSEQIWGVCCAKEWRSCRDTSHQIELISCKILTLYDVNHFKHYQAFREAFKNKKITRLGVD